MITLNTPPQVLSVLGGTAKVSYDKMLVSPFRFDPQFKTVEATIRLASTADPQMQGIDGTLRIQIGSSTLIMEVAQLDFYRKVSLGAPQVAALEAVIANAQNAIESGLISLGLVTGTQTAGV